jgi:hemoglobin-like flavoprotein
VADLHRFDIASPQDQLAILRGVFHRIAQAEHPEKFSIVKQVLLERLRELEEEAANTPLAIQG